MSEEQVIPEVVEEVTNEKFKVKVKILHSITTGIGHLEAGTTRVLELDDHTLTNWVENGLIEEVKTSKSGKADENQ